MIPLQRHILGSLSTALTRAQIWAFDYVYVRNTHITDSAEQTAIYNHIVASMGVGSYYDTTFGPSGQNKIVADFFYILKTSGNITTRTNTKSGATPRWDCDGTIYTQVNLPTHTKGTGAGWVIYSSTDGLTGIIRLGLEDNSFINSAPNWNLPNCSFFNILINQFSGTAPNWNLPSCTNLQIQVNQFSGTAPNWNLPNCIQFQIYSNQFSGSIPNWNLPNCTTYRIYSNQFNGVLNAVLKQTVTEIRANLNDFTDSTIYATETTSSYNLQTNNFTNTNINGFLNRQYLALFGKIPLTNCTYTLNGTGMAAPTGGNSNTDIVAIKGIYSTAGRTATITVNTV